LDFVFIVCDQAAREICPDWPGHPVTANWPLPDPAAVKGDDATKMRAFRDTFAALSQRIEVFVGISTATLDRLSLSWDADRRGRVLELVDDRVR
jgi:arsenate reductase